jgi:lipoprotein LpqS
LWIAVMGGQWGSQGKDDAPPHGPHVLSSTPHTKLVAIIEHPHLQDGSIPASPDTLAEAVLPRPANVLLMLAMCGAVVVLALFWRESLVIASRGPPRPVAGVLTGRDVLTRNCIARR